MKDYASPVKWHELIKECKRINFECFGIIKQLAEIVNSFKEDKESSAYMICRLEFKKNIPEKYHNLID